jgi:chromosome segregation ATPase
MTGIAAIDPVVGIIIAAVVGPLGAYLLAARKLSGKVATSDASELWAESKSIRQWSTARIEALDMEVSLLRTRVGLVEQQNDALARENSRLMEQIHDLNETITTLREEIVALTGELRSSRERVKELEGDADAAGNA